MSVSFYPHGKLCICSVQEKEAGFEDYRYMAYLAASSLGFEAIRNPERDGMTQKEFELCLRTQYPVCIFIVGTAGSNVVNEEIKLALKKCLPMLIFIKKQNGIISEESEELIRKLSDVSYNYECTTFSSCEELYKQVCERLKSYILDKASKHAVLQKDVAFAYRANTELLKKSKRQIAIYQNTSILLLGPRKGCQYENEFYKELTEWLVKNQNENISFVHVFNWDSILKEKQINYNNYNLEIAKENFMSIYRQYETENDSLNIRYSHVHDVVPYVITDTNLVFIIPIEGERFSIELPANIMKEREINTILDEITRKTTIMDLNKIMDFYN